MIDKDKNEGHPPKDPPNDHTKLDPEDWHDYNEEEKISFSPNFKEAKEYFKNHLENLMIQAYGEKKGKAIYDILNKEKIDEKP